MLLKISESIQLLQLLMQNEVFNHTLDAQVQKVIDNLREDKAVIDFWLTTPDASKKFKLSQDNQKRNKQSNFEVPSSAPSDVD